jgi:hypothetical protein
MGELLKRQDELTEVREAFIQGKLPLVNLFIYCSPCVPLIHTALSICQKVSSTLVKVHLRPDDRLASACCATVDRTLGLRSILKWVRDWEATAPYYESQPLASFLDSLWLDRRLEHLDYEQPYNYVEVNVGSSHILIIGEDDYLSPLLQRAPGRIPNATDIWRLNTGQSPTRTLFGRFIESRFVSRQAGPQTQMPPVPPQVQSVTPGVRKASSPVSAHSKRRKHEDGSMTASRGEESEDEDEDEDLQSQNHFSERSN